MCQLTCQNCELGKEKVIVGNGISEPPYVHVIKCPFDDEFYKNFEEACNKKDERERVMQMGN